jgi:hypothetical protein
VSGEIWIYPKVSQDGSLRELWACLHSAVFLVRQYYMGVFLPLLSIWISDRNQLWQLFSGSSGLLLFLCCFHDFGCNSVLRYVEGRVAMQRCGDLVLN